MCLLTRQIKPITTKKDLVVYKRLNITNNYLSKKIKYNSYYQEGYEYVKGILNTTTFGITKELPNDTISFDNIATDYYKHYNLLINRKLTVISEGFHACLTEERLNNYEISFEFLIPKGSLIFKDATGLIVSNQIIML